MVTYYVSIYTVNSGALTMAYENDGAYTCTNVSGTKFASFETWDRSGTTIITFYEPSDANQYGYVLNPYDGRGDNGSGVPISGAVVTIGTALPSTTSANGYYNINFSRYSFGFDNASTPVTVTAPGVGSYSAYTTVPVDSSSQVDYYLLPVSGYGGSMIAYGGKLMTTARKKHKNDMYTGLKLKM